MADRPEPEAALRVLRSAAQRARLATRLAGDPETALLQSIVDATVTLFDAEAASIAIFERDPDRLEFRVARAEDTLVDLAPELEVGYVELLAANPGVDPWLPKDGTRLSVPRARLLPSGPRDGIVVNLGDLHLYYF